MIFLFWRFIPSIPKKIASAKIFSCLKTRDAARNFGNFWKKIPNCYKCSALEIRFCYNTPPPRNCDLSESRLSLEKRAFFAVFPKFAAAKTRGEVSFFEDDRTLNIPPKDRGCPDRLGFECYQPAGLFETETREPKNASRNDSPLRQVRHCPCLSDGDDHGTPRQCAEHFVPIAMPDLRSVRCLLYHEAGGNGILELRTIFTTEKTQKMTTEQLMGFTALFAVPLYLYYLTIIPRL